MHRKVGSGQCVDPLFLLGSRQKFIAGYGVPEEGAGSQLQGIPVPPLALHPGRYSLRESLKPHNQISATFFGTPVLSLCTRLQKQRVQELVHRTAAPHHSSLVACRVYLLLEPESVLIAQNATCTYISPPTPLERKQVQSAETPVLPARINPLTAPDTPRQHTDIPQYHDAELTPKTVDSRWSRVPTKEGLRPHRPVLHTIHHTSLPLCPGLPTDFRPPRRRLTVVLCPPSTYGGVLERSTEAEQILVDAAAAAAAATASPAAPTASDMIRPATFVRVCYRRRTLPGVLLARHHGGRRVVVLIPSTHHTELA